MNIFIPNLIALLIMLPSIAGSAWGGVHYTVTDLGPINDEHSSAAYAINDAQEVVGASYWRRL